MGGRVKDRGSLGRVLVRFLTVLIPPKTGLHAILECHIHEPERADIASRVDSTSQNNFLELPFP